MLEKESIMVSRPMSSSFYLLSHSDNRSNVYVNKMQNVSIILGAFKKSQLSYATAEEAAKVRSIESMLPFLLL